MPKHSFARLFALIVLCTGLTMVGCDSSDSENDNPSIGGTYTSTITEDGETTTFELTFPNIESGAFDFSGTASSMSEGVTVSVPVTGSVTYDFPCISMNLTFTVAGSTNSEQVSGTVSSSADLMTLTDSAGDTITFRRQ